MNNANDASCNLDVLILRDLDRSLLVSTSGYATENVQQAIATAITIRRSHLRKVRIPLGIDAESTPRLIGMWPSRKCSHPTPRLNISCVGLAPFAYLTHNHSLCISKPAEPFSSPYMSVSLCRGTRTAPIPNPPSTLLHWASIKQTL